MSFFARKTGVYDDVSGVSGTSSSPCATVLGERNSWSFRIHVLLVRDLQQKENTTVKGLEQSGS